MGDRLKFLSNTDMMVPVAVLVVACIVLGALPNRHDRVIALLSMAGLLAGAGIISKNRKRIANTKFAGELFAIWCILLWIIRVPLFVRELGRVIWQRDIKPRLHIDAGCALIGSAIGISAVLVLVSALS